ncbi:hypothetical protein [Castellaniella sp.]|uniref:hypothetical protein n=1 Tax=Castellaniella sp. TaxID=1955812 RepID=UPI002AFFF06C|nr:hypothetical protein [Castellaniella sp.]
MHARTAKALIELLTTQAINLDCIHPDDADTLFAISMTDPEEDGWRKRRLWLLERAIVRKIVTDAASMGYTMNHFDGEYESEDNTNNPFEIMKAIMASDEESITFFNGDRAVGTVQLVYGNDGYDVIADNTENDEMNRILAGATAMSEAICEIME